MTLHSYITLQELVQYCQLCHEHKCKRVKVHKHTLARIRKVAIISVEETEFLGIKFLER